MVDQTDWCDLLQRYLGHVQRIERGNDLLAADHLPPFSITEVAALRSLMRPANPSAIAFERLGGTAPGTRPPHPHGWFQRSLAGLPE
jgi:hypothetical protein